MVTSDGPWTAARQIRLFVTRLSRHWLSLSPPPPIIDQHHRHRWQQWQAPVAHTPGELPRPFASLSLPKHQTGQDTAATSPTSPAHYPPTATSSTLTSTSEPDNERPAPNARPLPRHPLTTTSPGLMSASKPERRQQLNSSQHPPTATVNDNKPHPPPTYSTTKRLENSIDGSKQPCPRGGDGPECEQRRGQTKEGPGKHPQPTLPDCWPPPACQPGPPPISEPTEASR